MRGRVEAGLTEGWLVHETAATQQPCWRKLSTNHADQHLLQMGGAIPSTPRTPAQPRTCHTSSEASRQPALRAWKQTVCRPRSHCQPPSASAASTPPPCLWLTGQAAPLPWTLRRLTLYLRSWQRAPTTAWCPMVLWLPSTVEPGMSAPTMAPLRRREGEEGEGEGEQRGERVRRGADDGEVGRRGKGG